MHILMMNNRIIVNTSDLIEFVWGDDPSMIDPPVRIHIANVRKKLGDDNFQIIKTIPGTGYMLNDPPE